MTSPTYARVARIVTRVELPALLVLAPALLFPTPARLSVLAVVPVIWLCARRATGHAVPPTPMNPALWVLLAMVGVSLLVTFDVRFSLGKVSGVVLGTLLFWAVARWVKSPTRVAAATAAFVAAGAVLAVIGLLGTNWDNKIHAIGAMTSRLPQVIRGVPGAEIGFSSNAVAGCLVLFIPLQIALLRTRGWLGPVAWIRVEASWPAAVQTVLLGLTAGTLILTESRGAWFGLVVSAFAFLVWYRPWTRGLAAGGAAVGAALVSTLGYQQVFDVIVSRSGPALRSTLALRQEIWSRAIHGVQDFPLTGMGMNTFRKLMPALYPGYPYLPGEEVPHAHNHLLQAALDLGLPGLAAYVVLWGVAAALLVCVYRFSGDRGCRATAGGLGAGLIAHFVFGMTDAIPLGAKVGVLFWLALALTVALHQVARPRRPGLTAS